MAASLTFLGTGGGRFVVIQQLRATGGFVLEMDDEMIHIDPGPGALVRAKQFGVKLNKLTGVAVSHCHPDHYTDLEIVVEAMTGGAKKRRGFLVASEYVIKGGDGFRAAISDYHLKSLESYKALKPGDAVKLGNIKITATPTKHREPSGIGFVFEGSKRIGYTSDTEIIPDMHRFFKNLDCLIANVLRPRDKSWPEHMNTEDCSSFVSDVKPKLLIIQHFGMLMLRANPRKEAEWIESQTGIRTIAAEDGMRIDINQGLERFLH